MFLSSWMASLIWSICPSQNGFKPVHPVHASSHLSSVYGSRLQAFTNGLSAPLSPPCPVHTWTHEFNQHKYWSKCKNMFLFPRMIPSYVWAKMVHDSSTVINLVCVVSVLPAGWFWLWLAHLSPLCPVFPGRSTALLNGGLRNWCHHSPQGNRMGQLEYFVFTCIYGLRETECQLNLETQLLNYLIVRILLMSL